MENDGAPETQTIKALLEIMHEHDLDALKVKVGDQIFELVRREGPSGAPSSGAAAPVAAAPAPGGSPSSASATAKKVTAPLVGVFYRSPSPDAESFVNVGDRVEAG
ncbi:MAG TPA: hypothetical protein VFE17_00465, partial [Candidatus Baltobacteraceae bacterium]|nr:hypothetical protein [Candidatus Baltobacteraceae bacterium]